MLILVLPIWPPSEEGLLFIDHDHVPRLTARDRTPIGNVHGTVDAGDDKWVGGQIRLHAVVGGVHPELQVELVPEFAVDIRDQPRRSEVKNPEAGSLLEEAA